MKRVALRTESAVQMINEASDALFGARKSGFAHPAGLKNISKKWTMPIRDWKAALNRFTIQFDERMLPG